MSVRAQDDGRGAHAHAHEHDHDDDREHAGAGEPIALEDDPDLIVVRSVGIDIGSSTSHLIFSRIVLQRQGARLSSAFVVVDREILHRSPILLTPYSDARTIDTRALGDFVERSYAEAGLAPTDVDTGALIVTGNAALKDNAERIARAIASDAGRFVCATAGPHLESRLAAHGSGAVDRSRSGRTVVNVDIGGGTTKLAIARDGRVLETAALAVGARVVAVDAEGRVTRLEPGAQAAGRAARMRLELGSAVSPADREALAAVLCDALVSVLATRRFAGLALGLLVTEAIELPERIDELVLSGGVSEYIHGRETRDLGDLGPWLGNRLRERLAGPGLPPFADHNEGIRATVIGAGQYTLQVSGSTIFLSSADLLPMRDLRVVRPSLESLDALGVERGVARALERDRADGGTGRVAIALHAPVEPSYGRLREIAAGIAAGVASVGGAETTVLIFDTDLGRSIGAILHEELMPQRAIVAIDEVRVEEFDFVDLGRQLKEGGAVPVVVKTLVFRTADRPRAAPVAEVPR